MDTLNFIIGHKIRQKRMELKLTGKQVGRMLGISQQHYSRLENGNIKFTVDLLFTVASALEVQPQNLLPITLVSECIKECNKK